MSLDNFPDIGPQDWGQAATPEAKVQVIELGDGYELRQPAGINHTKDTWSLSWSFLSPGVAQSTYDWLKSRMNWKAFRWTDLTTGQVHKVVCTSVNFSHKDYNDCNLTANFKQDFNPV